MELNYLKKDPVAAQGGSTEEGTDTGDGSNDNSREDEGMLPVKIIKFEANSALPILLFFRFLR